MENKATIWFVVGFTVVVAVGLVILGVVYGTGSSSTPNSGFVATTAPAITASDWTIGSSTAPVTLIEYGDFQCPACGAYYPVVKQLLADEGNNVYFIFRNYPLYTLHPDASIAAQAAEAAGLQGKYWEMHDTLYTNQATWSAATPGDVVSKYFNSYATSLGMDVAKFDQDINSNQVLNRIQSDVAGGNTASIDHTPTFFVNLKQIPNPTSYADFKSTIDQAVSAAASSTH
jgi:protein-disulfide isomerase